MYLLHHQRCLIIEILLVIQICLVPEIRWRLGITRDTLICGMTREDEKVGVPKQGEKRIGGRGKGMATMDQEGDGKEIAADLLTK